MRLALFLVPLVLACGGRVDATETAEGPDASASAPDAAHWACFPGSGPMGECDCEASPRDASWASGTPAAACGAVACCALNAAEGVCSCYTTCPTADDGWASGWKTTPSCPPI